MRLPFHILPGLVSGEVNIRDVIDEVSWPPSLLSLHGDSIISTTPHAQEPFRAELLVTRERKKV